MGIGDYSDDGEDGDDDVQDNNLMIQPNQAFIRWHYLDNIVSHQHTLIY